MKSNLESLRLILNQSGSIRIALKYTGQLSEYESFWIIAKNEIDYVIRRLRGNEDTRMIIDDGNYHLAFGMNGIYCTELSSEKVIRHYVYFAGELLAQAIEQLKERTYQDNWRKDDENILVVSQDTINQSAWANRNQCKIIYHNDDYKHEYNVKDMIVRLCKDEKVKNEFRRFMKSNIRTAGESRGEFHIQLDGYNEKDKVYPSFYWYLLSADNKRIYNGGLINHGDDNVPNYSIHT